MAALSYTVLKPFTADVNGEDVRLEPGEQIPGPRVPEVESWGRSIDHLLNTHRIAAITTAVGEDADDETLLGELERRGADLAARVIGRLDPEALLAHMEETVEPEAVLARFSDEMLGAELERRAMAASVDEPKTEPQPDPEPSADTTAGSVPASDAGGADGGADAGEGGAGADGQPPQPPADAPAEPKPEPKASKPAEKKPAAKPKTKPSTKKG